MACWMEYGILPQDQSLPLSFPLVGLFLGTYTYVNINRDKNDIHVLLFTTSVVHLKNVCLALQMEGCSNPGRDKPK